MEYCNLEGNNGYLLRFAAFSIVGRFVFIQACCAGCRLRPFPIQISLGKIPPFMKITVTFDPIK